MYAGLTIIMIYDFRNHTKNKANTFLFAITCLLFPILIGGTIELLQPTLFAPRTASIGDFYADLLGVLAGWLAMYGWSKLSNKN